MILIFVSLVTSHWIDADGFCQGLWLYCVAGSTEYTCFAKTDIGLPVCIVNHSLQVQIDCQLYNLICIKFYFGHKSGGEVLCVCASVCLSNRISPEPHTRSLQNFSAHVAYGRGLVVLQQGDEITRVRGSFGGFPPR